MGDLISREAAIKVLNSNTNIRTIRGGVSGIWINLLDVIGEIERVPATEINGSTSDGYHTFDELYHHRAVLFSLVVKAFLDSAWKSRKHHDGTMYDGMFIVGVDTPDGQATYHYDIDPYWDMFVCRELECAPEWDGHSPAEAIDRIGKLLPLRHGHWAYDPNANDWGIGGYVCSECHAKNNNLPCAKVATPLVFVGANYCPNCGAKMDGDGE